MTRHPQPLGLATILSFLFLVAFAPLALAAGPSQNHAAAFSSALNVDDVMLHDGGILVGQVAGNSTSMPGEDQVTIWQQGRRLASATPDQHGRFAIQDLRPGVYELASRHGRIIVRLWHKRLAPRSARPFAVLSPQAVVRGQGKGNRLLSCVDPSDVLLWGTIGGVGFGVPLSLSKPASN